MFLTLSFQTKTIEKFNVQLEITEEAKAYVSTLSQEAKENWFSTIPDSIPLKATCVFKFNNDFNSKVYFKLGTIDGIGDLFEGSFDLNTNTGTNGIIHTVIGDSHYFNIGNLAHLKKFTAFAWVNDESGKTIDVAKYQK